MQLKKKMLGSTGMEVSVIGFGGIPIQRLAQEQAIEVILECKKQGINFIDTARAYTVSESYIGAALKKAGRENFYIATKANSFSYDEMKNSIQLSLKALDIDCIDLYQVHNPGTLAQIDQIVSDNGALKALKEAKAAGLIKHIGITGHLKEVTIKALDYDDFETVQFPFNPVESQGKELLEKALSLGKGTIAMKPIAGGAFSNALASLKYILNSDLITVAIPGMDSVEQVKINASAGKNVEPLTEEEIDLINNEVKELGNNFCRRCGYCKPCPEWIDIPMVFIAEGYANRYNLYDYGKSKYDALSIKADACVRCRKCERKCPYNLPIVDMLKHAVETFK